MMSFSHNTGVLIIYFLFSYPFFFSPAKGWVEREPCHFYDRAEESSSNWTDIYWPVLEDRF